MFARLPFDEAAWLAEAGHSRAAAGESGLQHAGADLGPADRRGQRHVGRAHRPGRQDHHPGGGARQAVVPAGRAPGARGCRRRAPGVRGATHSAGHRSPGHGRRARRPALVLPGRLTGRAARPDGPWGVRSGRKFFSPARAAAGPRPTWPTILGAPLVFLAVGLDSDRIHAPNEKVEMPLLLKGAEAAAYLWDEFAAARGRAHGVAVSAAGPSELSGRVRAGQPRAVPRRAWTGPRPARGDDEWLAAAWADPGTRVLVVDSGQALVRSAGDAHGARVRAARGGARRGQVPAGHRP